VINCALLVLLILVQLPKKDAGAGLAFGGGAATRCLARARQRADQNHEMGTPWFLVLALTSGLHAGQVATKPTARWNEKQFAAKHRKCDVRHADRLPTGDIRFPNRQQRRLTIAVSASVRANQCPEAPAQIEITQCPFFHAPGGFFRGRVLLLGRGMAAGLRPGLRGFSGCVRREPPATHHFQRRRTPDRSTGPRYRAGRNARGSGFALRD